MQDMSTLAKVGLGVSLVMFAMLVMVGANRSGPKPLPNSVYVTETDYHISASRTTFHPGVTYHFIVKNTSTDLHEFMIGPMMPSTSMTMAQMDAMSLAMLDSIAPGETETISVTFPKAPTHVMNAMPGMSAHPAPQPLEFSCHLPGHYEAGMQLPLTVMAN